MARYMSKHALFLLLLWAVLGISVGCNSEEPVAETLDRYYYNPLTFDHTGVVYRYTSLSDQMMPEELWHYRFDPGFRGSYLHASMFTPAGDVVQRSVERLDANSATMLSLDLYYMDEDTLREIRTKVTEDQTFEFRRIDEKPTTRFIIEYIDPVTDTTRVILKKQRYVEGMTTYEVDGISHPAVEVRTVEVLETETEGFTESEWNGIEIYAMDLGLVYYRKNISEGFVLEYELAEIIPYDQFRSRYGINPD